MKEASGELSMTAITVVSIAAIAALVSAFIMPGLKRTIENKSACAQAYDCKPDASTPGKFKCYWDKQNSTGGFDKTEVTCNSNSGG